MFDAFVGASSRTSASRLDPTSLLSHNYRPHSHQFRTFYRALRSWSSLTILYKSYTTLLFTFSFTYSSGPKQILRSKPSQTFQPKKNGSTYLLTNPHHNPRRRNHRSSNSLPPHYLASPRKQIQSYPHSPRSSWWFRVWMGKSLVSLPISWKYPPPLTSQKSPPPHTDHLCTTEITIKH